jgi:hypothetical protein
VMSRSVDHTVDWMNRHPELHTAVGIPQGVGEGFSTSDQDPSIVLAWAERLIALEAMVRELNPETTLLEAFGRYRNWLAAHEGDEPLISYALNLAASYE